MALELRGDDFKLQSSLLVPSEGWIPTCMGEAWGGNPPARAR